MAKTVLNVVVNTSKSVTVRCKKAPTLAKKRATGRDRNIGTSPEKKRAMQAFIIKYDIGRGASVTQCVVSMNRVAYVIATNKRALNEFVKISKML
jgi:hypothetical protein